MEPTGRREAPPDDRLRAIRGPASRDSRISLRSIRATMFANVIARQRVGAKQFVATIKWRRRSPQPALGGRRARGRQGVAWRQLHVRLERATAILDGRCARRHEELQVGTKK